MTPVPYRRRILHGIAVTDLEAADGARATVADHGAQLLSWQPAGGAEVLYLSPASGFNAGQAIRGGVPVIFPQFGERGAGRRHGDARLQAWEFGGAEADGGAVSGIWRLRGRLDRIAPMAPALGDDALARGDAAFLLALTLRLGGDGIDIGLRIENTGQVAWQAHAALHTYLGVGELAQVAINGLQGRAFQDNAAPGAGGAAALQPGEAGPLRFEGEVDRLYPQAPTPLQVDGTLLPLTLQQAGFGDTVVWNPGAAKGAALADLPPAGHAAFVCIEAAAVTHPIALAPGAWWQGHQQLRRRAT